MTQSINPPVKILFVCIGNACRSQMAEAWANHFGKGRVQASSAGSHPLGSITKDTYTVMSEKGISLDGQWSKGLCDVAVAEMDVVVGMGCEVDCPVPIGFKGRVVDWEVPDPYGWGIESFRNVRDMVERQVLGLLADLIAPDVPE
ncbi:MAG TPA: arsenate reductase ArsC [Terriglobia bacterium]|nr:arsenate reductase ArsC [Terriglobia bacterium]